MPAAFSPVCSNQASAIEERRAAFEGQGAIPVTISSDGAWSLKAWKEQMGIQFPVLSDFNPQGGVAKAYGVLIEGRGVANRVVVVVGKNGRVAWIQPSAKIVELPDYDPVLSCSKE